jgi:trehalose synthase-fused probable maltokinase
MSGRPRERGADAETHMEQIPGIRVAQSWEELFTEDGRSRLAGHLPTYLMPRRWFGSKARTIRAVSLREWFRMPFASSAVFFTLVDVDFAKGMAEQYVVPFAFAAASRPAPRAHALVARIEGAETGVVYDALADEEFCAALLEMIGREASFKGQHGELRAAAMEGFAARRGSGRLEPFPGSSEQSNTSVIYGERLILKVFRRVEEGINPELEIGRFLTERAHFPHTSPVVGAIEYDDGRSAEPTTLALLQGFVPNRGDAWKFTMEKVNQFAGCVRREGGHGPEPLPEGHLLDAAGTAVPAGARRWIGDYLDSARLLGQRTAELHLALSGSSEPSAFKPEPFSLEHQRLLVRTLLEVVERDFAHVQAHADELPGSIRDTGRKLTEKVPIIRRQLEPMQRRPLGGRRCRCHGDYHLGQVLDSGQDFIIIDFEGEPARPLHERRLKQSPLRDVAGMLRSFDYAAHSVELPEDWHRFWYAWVSAAFLNPYLATAAGGTFLPSSRDDIKLLLDYYLLEKAVYELAYEINHRPDWVRIPLMGILHLVSGEW